MLRIVPAPDGPNRLINNRRIRTAPHATLYEHLTRVEPGRTLTTRLFAVSDRVALLVESEPARAAYLMADRARDYK